MSLYYFLLYSLDFGLLEAESIEFLLIVGILYVFLLIFADSTC